MPQLFIEVAQELCHLHNCSSCGECLVLAATVPDQASAMLHRTLLPEEHHIRIASCHVAHPLAHEEQAPLSSVETQLRN